MSDEDSQGHEREIRDRVAAFMQAEQGRQKPIPDQEQQTLKAASGRLDELLARASQSEHQVLQAAVSRLDQMLADIASGKEITTTPLRRQETKDIPE